jgi:4-amino-4-deoxy-L-arabinose transferase-like glycosyltransferase
LRITDAMVLTVVLAAALAWPLRAPPIASHGEAREGLVVHDIVWNGEWVLPRRNGELPSKPPLFHWIAAGTAHAVGLSDAVVRFPSALGAVAMLLATFALGVTIGGRVSAWLAAGALLGTHGFWEAAWEARVDMVFAAAVTIALVAFFLWYRAGRPLARVVCHGAIACAVLAKGPAGAALPALVIIAFVARESWRDRASRPDGALGGVLAVIRRFWSWPLVALVVAVDLGWYLLAFREGGTEFLRVQLLHENVDRVIGRGVFGMHGGRSRFAMLIELATDLVPWNLVLVWGVVAWLRGHRADVGERFLHAWWIVVVAVFTIAFGKRDVYLLPLYPAIALLAGRALAGAVETRLFGVLPAPAWARRRFPTRPALATLAIAIVAFDITLVTVSELVRVHRVRRKSLLSFVAAVAAEVPGDALLYATPDLAGSDLQVLAYRLRRDIPRAPLADGAASGDAYYLLPAANDDALRDARYHRIATSARRGSNVVLVRGETAAER